jgi:hypothetical protein
MLIGAIRRDCTMYNTACPDNPNEENPTMADARRELHASQSSRITFNDHQPQMPFGVQAIGRQLLKNSTVARGRVAAAGQFGGSVP